MVSLLSLLFFFFFQAEDGIRDWSVTGVQTCALPIYAPHEPGHPRVARSAPVQRPAALRHGGRGREHFGDVADGALLRRHLCELRPATRGARQSLRQVPQRPSHPPALPRRRGGSAAALSALPAPAARRGPPRAPAVVTRTPPPD